MAGRSVSGITRFLNVKNRFCMVLLHRGMCSCHESIFFSEESKAGFYGRVSCQAMLRKARLTFI